MCFCKKKKIGLKIAKDRNRNRKQNYYYIVIIINYSYVNNIIYKLIDFNSNWSYSGLSSVFLFSYNSQTLNNLK